MTHPLLLDIAGGFSDKGPIRKANEDSFILPDPNAPTDLGLIYVVADGVGGQEHGAEASQLAVRIIHDVFYQTRQVGESIPVALTHAADQANLAIYDQAQKRQAGRMGCTVVTAVHHQGQRYILHAGDARAYLLRQGKLKKLTRDDTWVQRQVEEGLIGENTAQHHELRHVVTRVLGNNPTAEFTVSKPMPIQPDDTLLLCSDGLHDVMDDGQMIQILADYVPQAAAETLVETAVHHKTQDNVTAIVVRSQAEGKNEATIPSPMVAAKAPETIAMTAAMPNAMPIPEQPDAATPARRQSGVRLPLWVLASLAVALILAVILGGTALFRQLRTNGEATPSPATAVLPTDVPPTVVEVTAVSPTEQPAALPTLMETAVPPPTLTPLPPTTEPSPAETTEPAATEAPATNLACIANAGALTFVWQDAQIVGSNCNQFAQEGFVLNDGDPVTILDATPRGVLGPDPSCQENEFIKVQSTADPAITGWVLVDNVQTTTAEQGCPP
ncbi:MAG: protein phosphatase 2C domain-containing protein [Ardenticatenaceae bacterium]|nr:protein phosphatase 2C domain-containing protein [Ardenticatenaceae bacterium]